MNRFKAFYAAAIATVMFSGAAQAGDISSYDFGTLLSSSSGYSAPNSFGSDPFANLKAENNGGIWTFTLTVNNNLFSNFGQNAFIGDMEFDFAPNPQEPVSTFLDSNLDGVTSVSTTSGNCTGGLTCFDFGTKFGLGAKNRLSGNDFVSWNVSNLGLDSTLANMYLHVQGIDGGYSAKYTPVVSSVPEPETYAMLLAGLGLLGFAGYRSRKETQSEAIELGMA